MRYNVSFKLMQFSYSQGVIRGCHGYCHSWINILTVIKVIYYIITYYEKSFVKVFLNC